MQKLEENLAYDRKIISDLQAVSIVYKLKYQNHKESALRERDREKRELLLLELSPF